MLSLPTPLESVAFENITLGRLYAIIYRVLLGFVDLEAKSSARIASLHGLSAWATSSEQHIQNLLTRSKVVIVQNLAHDLLKQS